MTAAFLARLARASVDAQHAGLRRTLEARASAQLCEVSIGGRALVNFTSNDYLGLAAHPRVLARVAAELPHHGFGAGAAALLSGRSSLHAELEEKLAKHMRAESALLFSSGYLANLGALPALVSKQDFVAHDRLNHASLIDAVRASYAPSRRYPHATVAAVATTLAERPGRERFIVTESIFSMDGDAAPLNELTTVARQHDAILYVDDAHGYGVTHAGRGASAELDLDSAATPTTIVMTTFGKALASAGAAVVGPAPVIEQLIQRARTFIYDTALPAVCAAAALEALDIIINDGNIHQRLAANIALFRLKARHLCLPLLPSLTAIQPLIIGDETRALALSVGLARAGFYVRAIRPPTVPAGTARLRITLTAAHTATQIEGLLDTCAELLEP